MNSKFDSRAFEMNHAARPAFFLILLLMIMPASSDAQSRQNRQVPVDSLIYDLKNPDPVRRKEAANLLGANKVQRAVPDLVAASNDKDAPVRREVILALDQILDPRALPAFVSLMSDPEKDIREKCLHGIINLYLPKESGLVVTATRVANFFNPWADEWADVMIEPGITVDPSVTGALRDRLHDSEEIVRIKAARALGILRGKEATAAILNALAEDRSNGVRFELIRSLGKIGDPGVSKDLMSFIGYSDSKVRNQAVLTLGRFRYREASGELTRLYEKESALPQKEIDKPYRELLLDAVAFIADPGSKEFFVKEWKNPDNTLRLHAVEGLARIEDTSLATEISRDYLQEKDARLRAAQAYALYRMGRKEYLDMLVSALGNRKSHNEARQYLVELRPNELPDLLAHTKNKEVGIRESLCEVLGLIGDSSVVPALQELAKDGRGEITALANQAMRRINARGGTR